MSPWVEGQQGTDEERWTLTGGFSRSAGAKLYDVNGKEYLDFLSGIAVHAVGHSHPTWWPP